MSARKAGANELSKETIMNAARELFTKKGYQHVSMRQIARQLNCSHGAIYYHFENKAALFYALVEEHFRMLDDELEAIASQEIPAEEKLVQIFIRYIEFGLNHQSHYEIMFLVKDEEVINFINEGPTKTYDKFAKVIATYSEKQLTIQEVWSIFLALHGFVTHYIRHVVDFDEAAPAAKVHANLLLQWTKK